MLRRRRAVAAVTAVLTATTEEIDGSGAQVWEYATTPDGDVYFGTTKTGEILRFDPNRLTFERIAEFPFGQSHVFSATTTPEGEVLFGTYPDGKIISYDPDTDAWHDYGTIVAGTHYIRRMSVNDEYIYAGTGTAGTLIRIDRATGDVENIPLPAAYADSQFVDDASIRRDLLFVHPQPADDLLVYSLSEQAWVDTIPDVAGLSVSPIITTQDSGQSRDEVLYKLKGSDVVAYDLATRERRVISLAMGGAARGWGFMELSMDDFPGTSVVTATSNGVFWSWNPQTGATATHRHNAAKAPFYIRSLATGRRDNFIFAGGYASPPGIGRYNADSGGTVQLRFRGQPEDIVAHDRWLVLGTYTGARLHAYDTTQPWEDGTNPGPAVVVGHEQDRPLALASAGDVVAVGTMPYYGTLGGALSLFDPETGDLDVFRNVVQDQTVLSLAYHGGLIYGGTSIWGGIGIDPTTTEGHLFIFDPATSDVVYSGVPVPGARNVSALTFDDDGYLWGITANELFKFDPVTREVVLTETYFDIDDAPMYAKGRELLWHDGTLVGSTAGRIFEIDPDTLEMTVLTQDAHNLAIDGYGSYYFSRGSSLFRLVRVPEPPCDVTIDGEHVGPVRVDDGTTCITDATVTGPVQVAQGANLVMTGTTLDGPLASSGAASVTVRGSEITGAVSVNRTAGTFVLSGTTIVGPLACFGNTQAPDDEGVPNTVHGPTAGQCVDL